MDAGSGEGQPGVGLGDSVSGRALGCLYQWTVRSVGGYWQAFLGIQVPLWEAPFITLMIILGVSLS